MATKVVKNTNWRKQCVENQFALGMCSLGNDYSQYYYKVSKGNAYIIHKNMYSTWGFKGVYKLNDNERRKIEDLIRELPADNVRLALAAANIVFEYNYND